MVLKYNQLCIILEIHSSHCTGFTTFKVTSDNNFLKGNSDFRGWEILIRCLCIFTLCQSQQKFNKYPLPTKLTKALCEKIIKNKLFKIIINFMNYEMM